jgi:hypothetical protein
MTTVVRKIVGLAALILVPIAYLAGSEVHYARSISPRGISTVRDFFGRFGEPRRVRMVQHDGHSYYEFTGHLSSGFALATPSAPPAYIFDEQGRFAAWCRDPGDNPSFRQTWPLQSTNKIEIALVREKFGLR